MELRCKLYTSMHFERVDIKNALYMTVRKKGSIVFRFEDQLHTMAIKIAEVESLDLSHCDHAVQRLYQKSFWNTVEPCWIKF